ncbi:MAG: hypothetical protein ABEJ61_04020 [Haloferacaceae archaeon]
MEVRDAVESDAERLAAVGDAPTDVMRNLVHDRTVRVAVREAGSAGPNADAADDDGEAILGFVSFDARDRTVHVTQIAGTPAACERLLAEPVRFASGEGMAVELLVGEGDETASEAAQAVGFERTGAGPQFDGRPTTRYRLDPN